MTHGHHGPKGILPEQSVAEDSDKGLSIEAYNMVKQLENDWQSKGNDKSSFYCGVRHELSV